MKMYWVAIYFFLPVIDTLIITKIHRNSVYHPDPDSHCASLGNISNMNDPSIQSCIWQCVDQYDCQTATYFEDSKICSLFSELCEKGSIEPSGTIPASVICYPKNHRPTATCSSTATTKQQDESTTTVQHDSTTPREFSTSLWSFENNTLDSLSNFHGESRNNASYKTPGINGYGSALWLNQNKEQFVEVSQHRGLDDISFTVEMWFYCTHLTNNDYGLFGQYHHDSRDLSLHYQIRGFQLQLAFFADDLFGSTTIQINRWYHVAFVYDLTSSTQQIYFNEKLDGNRSSNSYQGTTGSIVIGKNEYTPGTSNYFYGYIDEVLLTMQAKNSREILVDATLVCWYSFDRDSSADSGPLRLNETSMNITFVSGRIDRAINFTSNSSYFQIVGFVLLGISNHPYSIALWVCPYALDESVLVHLSTVNNPGWCRNLIQLSSNGQLIVTSRNPSTLIAGPILPLNAWTHIAHTYSTTNELRLYINGTLNSSTTVTAYSASGEVNILTLGNPSVSCVNQSNIHDTFPGSIDEFRVYSRELNLADIQTLVN